VRRDEAEAVLLAPRGAVIKSRPVAPERQDILMKIPYGLPNFGDIRRDGYFYVDKTPFLSRLEELGPRYLLFLRPRRMGKSLFVSLLEHYYDIGRADQFEALFKGLHVFEHPTPERNRYMVLSFDFSSLATDGGIDTLRRTFLQLVKARIQLFLLRYKDSFPPFSELHGRLGKFQEADALLYELLSIASAGERRLYVLIDEYDTFANRLLSGGEQEVYESIVQRTGFVRSFYSAFKAGATSGSVSRIFITGVTPLFLDDLSSGFNIATHISEDRDLSTMAGFTRADVERAVDELLASRRELAGHAEIADRERLMEVLERYYNGYRFSQDAAERVYNSDMVLYFLSEADRNGRYPADMLDKNVRTDYERLQRLGHLSGAAASDRRALLETIASEGRIRGTLIRQFGHKSLSSQDQFLSLLYYIGMLTLSERRGPGSQVELEIPNRVIRELQWEHLAQLMSEQASVRIDTRELEAALGIMAERGEIRPFWDLFHERVIKAMGNKDLRRLDEKSIKLMLLAFIALGRVYHPLSEKEFAQGYCDLFLGVSPLHPETKFAWLLELKYLPSGAKKPAIEKAFEQAQAQVARYASDTRLVPTLTRGHSLRAGSLVFVGAREVLFRPWAGEAAPAVGGAGARAKREKPKARREAGGKRRA
jgi:hypothetical protein